MNRRVLIIIMCAASLVLGLAAFWFMNGRSSEPSVVLPHADRIDVPAPPEPVIERVTIEPNMTFGAVMKSAGVADADAAAIYAAAKPHYDLASIRAGISMIFAKDPETAELVSVVYPVSIEEELRVMRTSQGWEAKREAIAYEIRKRKAKGTVESSLYAAGLKQGVDERAVIALADVFQWTIDFAQDVRVGDTFEFLYEELWRDGRFVMPGRVLTATYTNDGHVYQAYLYTNAKGEEGYFDETGDSLRKMFLKAPVAFKYITSGYTTGLRYVSAFNTSTGHRAIDYAAKTGTPIRATAAGTVSFAGRNGPYGNMVSIRHNGTYSTNYAHQSKMAVKKGQKVEQGQIIGYVGSTGFSTGPHLHYEMVKNGVKINPLRETFPATDPVAKEELDVFKQTAAELSIELANATM